MRLEHRLIILRATREMLSAQDAMAVITKTLARIHDLIQGMGMTNTEHQTKLEALSAELEWLLECLEFVLPVITSRLFLPYVPDQVAWDDLDSVAGFNLDFQSFSDRHNKFVEEFLDSAEKRNK